MEFKHCNEAEFSKLELELVRTILNNTTIYEVNCMLLDKFIKNLDIDAKDVEKGYLVTWGQNIVGKSIIRPLTNEENKVYLKITELCTLLKTAGY